MCLRWLFGEPGIPQKLRIRMIRTGVALTEDTGAGFYFR